MKIKFMLKKLVLGILVISWVLGLVPTTVNASTAQTEEFNRRISRINEYDDDGVRKVHTFQYNDDGTLASYSTTYYDVGKSQGTDEWEYTYDDGGKLSTEDMTNERGYYRYTHIIYGENNEKTGYQTMYGRGIQQHFTFSYDESGRISRITGEGVHDWFYDSDMEYTYDDKEQTASCTGTVSGTENSVYELTKIYDFSHPGVVFVEEQHTLNGQKLPDNYYLRVDMPQYISIPKVKINPTDEIRTDKDGYVTKLLKENGALRCEFFFDYIRK